jgi:hypothetical protein
MTTSGSRTAPTPIFTDNTGSKERKEKKEKKEKEGKNTQQLNREPSAGLVLKFSTLQMPNQGKSQGGSDRNSRFHHSISLGHIGTE